MKEKSKKQKKTSWIYAICMVVLIVYSCFFLYTNIWGVLTSFKTMLNIKRDPLGLPQKWMFQNYLDAFNSFKVTITNYTTGSQKDYYLEHMLFNSLLYSVGCTFFATMVPCLVAYATAKYKFAVNKFIYGAVIFAMAVPIVGALPSEIRIAKALGFHDNLLGMWLMKANFLGMYYLMFYAHFKGIPWEYAESVFIDGGGHYTVLMKIMLPLSKTTIWAIAVLLFITFWNDYQTPMMFLPSMPTAALGLYVYQFANSRASDMNMQMTGCFILMIPMLILFILMKNKMMGNLTVGGLKG